MKLFSLIIIATAFLSVSVSSQSRVPGVNYLDFQKRIGAYNISSDTYKDIKGCPYLNENFIDGEVVMKGDTTFKLPLRFNVYNSTFEFQLNGKAYNIGNPDMIKGVSIGTKKFVYYKNNIDRQGFYYELHVDGNYALISKKRIRLDEEDPGDGIRPEKPAKFVHLKDDFYLITNTGTKHISNKKVLFKSFDDKLSEIKAYIKEKKLSIKNVEDLTEIVNYYNGLTM